MQAEPKATIMNVDDYETGRYTVSRILRQAGFEVLEAATGHEALRLAAQQPDLIVLDVNLPDMSGFEVCRRIKANPATASMAVLHLSATYTGSFDRVHGLEAGADAYLAGPVEPLELVATVKALLRMRRAEQEVRALAGHWQTTFDAISDGIALLDPEGRVVRCNLALARMLEKPTHEVAGRTYRELAPGGGEVPFVRMRESRRREEIDLPAGGRWFRVISDPVLDADGALSGAVCIVSDVTDRKRAEEALALLAAASSELAASLDYESTLAAVARIAVPGLADWCLVDLLEAEGSITRAAVAHADPEKEALARALRRYPPDPGGLHPVAEVLRTGRPVLLPEVSDAAVAAGSREPEHLQLARQLGLASFMCVPLTAKGRTLGALSFAAAAPRRYGQADLDLAQELARRAALAADNARLYLAAQQAVQEARDAIGAREAFLARAAHDLRTPLTSVLGTIRLLERALAGRLNEPPAMLVEIASRNLAAMLVLINDLLDASKLVSGQAALALEPVELAHLVRGSFDVVGAQARDKGVSLRSAVPAALRLPADPLKLEQVLVNLLANATRFTPRGGEVVVEAEATGDWLLIRVRDTGEGIVREHLEQIFDPFFQSRKPADRRERQVRGTGLGLTICRQIVTLHGGEIWAESEGPDRGSTFTVRLPLAPPDDRAV